jgi:hypothetical protein
VRNVGLKVIFIELSTLNYFGDAEVEGAKERYKFDQIFKNVRSIHQQLNDRGSSDFTAVVFPHVQRLPENNKIKTAVGFSCFFVKFVVASSVIGLKSHSGHECKSAF